VVGSQNSLKKHSDNEVPAIGFDHAADSRTIDNYFSQISKSSFFASIPQSSDVRQSRFGEDVETKPMDKTLLSAKQKGLVMHCEFGGPARRAFLTSGDTQGNEPKVDLTEGIEITPENSFITINLPKASNFSKPRELRI
jgi:hypothetical protein